MSLYTKLVWCDVSGGGICLLFCSRLIILIQIVLIHSLRVAILTVAATPTPATATAAGLHHKTEVRSTFLPTPTRALISQRETQEEGG